MIPVTKQEKLNTNLSVAEVAFFMKVLHDAKVIKSENATDLINFLANYVRTDRSTTISPGSLRNKYYNVESSTVESMKGVIKDLMKAMMGDLGGRKFIYIFFELVIVFYRTKIKSIFVVKGG